MDEPDIDGTLPGQRYGNEEESATVNDEIRRDEDAPPEPRYSDDYGWVAQINSPRQDSYWLFDASLSLYSDDGKHSINFIGRNLGDEIVIIGGGAIPGRIQRQEGTSSLLQDQTATTTLGRTLTLQYKFRM